ncbi:hypothetical protein TrRE_jg2813, partial [Triparma retinervis]
MYKTAFIQNPAKDPSVELTFADLNELTNYIKNNRLATNEVLAYASHEPFQLSMDSQCVRSDYTRKVLRKELKVALASLYDFKPGKKLKGIQHNGAFNAKVEACFEEIVEKKTNFVFVDQVDWEEKRYQLINMVELKECSTIEGAKAKGILMSLKDILSDSIKKKTLFLPPKDLKTNFEPLEFI